MINIEHYPLGLVASKNPIIVEMHDDEGSQPNHRFVVQATISNAAKTVNIYLLVFPIGNNGVIDFSSLMDAFLNEVNYILPDLALTHTTFQNVSAGLLCNLSIQMNTAYGFPLIEVDDMTGLPNEGTYKCLRGGFSYPNWPERKYMFDWIMQAGNNLPFLTWKPKVSYISAAQPEFLTFIDVSIAESASRNLQLHVDIKYTDGSSATFSGGVVATNGFKAYQLAVGITQLNLTAVSPSKTILYYKVHLKETGVKISEERTYYVDYHKYQAERFVLFANSLAGWDTVRFVGTGEFQADYARLNSDVAQGKYSNSHGTVKVFQNEEQGGRKMNTGFISRTDVQWLRDLFLSTEVQIIENGKLIPILLTSKKFAMQEESSLNALSIEYDYRFKNEVYTPSYQPVNYEP